MKHNQDGSPASLPPCSPAQPPPRYLSDEPFPLYAFVPGAFPHPTRHPDGHSYGQPEPEVRKPEPDAWRRCRPYLRGIDLFNHGYYWEAHEAWEALWQACGRKGVTAMFFKGLIKLAAAGVKARQGQPAGVRRHALRAAAHFREVLETTGPSRYMGLSPGDLIRYAQTVYEAADTLKRHPDRPVEIVCPVVLRPS